MSGLIFGAFSQFLGWVYLGSGIFEVVGQMVAIMATWVIFCLWGLLIFGVHLISGVFSLRSGMDL